MNKFEKLVFGLGWTISRVSTQAIITLVRSHQFSRALVLEEPYAARGQYTIKDIFSGANRKDLLNLIDHGKDLHG
jgi:hypothetical protein